MKACLLLLGQKFTGTFVAKMLIYWELPSLFDSTFYFLLGLHFAAFFFVHSKPVRKILLRYRNSPYRKLIQETFKGYGKGLKMIWLVEKVIEKNLSVYYCVFVIMLRCSAAAIYKTTMLKLMLSKPLKFYNVKKNFFITSLPSIIIFIVLKNYTSQQ